jgi:hypothetical protein
VGVDLVKWQRDMLIWFLIFCGPPKGRDSSTVETIHVSRLHYSLECHRYDAKQTTPLQVNNLITNKSVGILEASRRILNTQCVKTSVLANTKNF